MTLREMLHRWAVLFYFCLVMALAAWRSFIHARRRKAFAHMDPWPW